MRLAGKTAIVTGGGSGIGKAIAAAFVREGAKVAVCGRHRERLDAAAAQLGANCLPIVADVADDSALSHLISSTVQRFGSLHILVNNAGVLLPGTAESLTEEQWQETFSVNVRAVWQLSRSALPHMRAAGGGSIINIGSVLSSLGARNRVAYAASKGAVLAMTRAMALDHAAENIRINCISPGIVETELVAAFNQDEAARRQRIAMHPMGRFGQPNDIAGLAVFLASDESGWITGADYTVDGGYSAH
ncbi:MAG TPA: SDR family oxidoreductase [Candidatus Limnocylindrales bacterium]|jgi:NAD(P)-dependent dehydrogenase (short-subunit alcohol dehydrogenase family)|nr:SDR family oxidoreductase [Candidatus Limnocylindrales bacterium]